MSAAPPSLKSVRVGNYGFFFKCMEMRRYDLGIYDGRVLGTWHLVETEEGLCSTVAGEKKEYALPISTLGDKAFADTVLNAWASYVFDKEIL